MLFKLLADENIPAPTIEALRSAGHDVLSIREDASGISDEEVLRMSVAQKRILVTFDRDFGELVFRMGLAAPTSILYLRFDPMNPTAVNSAVFSLLADPDFILGRMVIVTDLGIRRRDLPEASQ